MFSKHTMSSMSSITTYTGTALVMSCLVGAAVGFPATMTNSVNSSEMPAAEHLWFRYVYKGSNPECNATKFPICVCGEVDVAAVTPITANQTATSRVPAALLKPWNAFMLKAYANLTVQLYNYRGAKLELGRCAEIGYARMQDKTPGPWAPTSMMTDICQKQCDCAYPDCPDVPDEPLKGKWCSLCGPKYNANFYVQLYIRGQNLALE